jgi:hypothetical protein
VSKANESGDRITRWLRWIARGMGSLPAPGRVTIGLNSVLVDPEPWTWELTCMVFFITALAVIMVLAWRGDTVLG